MALASLDDTEGRGGDPVCSPLERKGGVRLCLVSERNVNSRSWFVLEEGALLVHFIFILFPSHFEEKTKFPLPFLLETELEHFQT